MTDQAPQVIFGWDIGGGGGARAKWLPCEPEQLVLAPARLNFVAGEGLKVARFELWGLDPRLTVAISFARARNSSLVVTGSMANVTTADVVIPGAGGIRAETLAKMGREVVTIADIDPALLFSSGGSLGLAVNDGCELATAAEGVRFYLNMIRTADNSMDVVANLVVRPNQPLGCRELALELAEQLVVRNLEQIAWDGAP